MKYVDFATSAWMFAIIVGFFVLEGSVIAAVTKKLGGDEKPGKKATDILKGIVTWQVIQTFLQSIFMSLQSFQKITGWTAIAKGTTFWPWLLSIQCCV